MNNLFSILNLKAPKLVVGTILIKRKRYMRFLGIMIDEYMTWKDHIRTAENKIAKNIGILYEPNNYSTQVPLKVFIFHIFLHILTTQTLHGQVHKKPNCK